MKKKSYTTGYRGEVIRMVLTHGILPYEVFNLYTVAQMKQYRYAVHTLEEEGILGTKRPMCGRKIVYMQNFDVNDYKFQQFVKMGILDKYKTLGIKKLYLMNSSSESREGKKNLVRDQNKALDDIISYTIAEIADPHIKESYYDEDTDKAFEYSKDLMSYYSRAYLKSRNLAGGTNGKQSVLATQYKHTQKWSSTRLNGMLHTAGGDYCMYCSQKKIIIWDAISEMKIVYYLEMLINACVGKANGQREAIFLFKNNKIYDQLMNLSVGRSRSGGKELIITSKAYDSVYGIPLSQDGISTLRLMSRRNWKQTIKANIFSQAEIDAAEYVTVGCDAYDSNKNTYKLCYCIPDFNKLSSFIIRANIENRRDGFEVYCYSYQAPIIKKLVGNTAKVFQVDIQMMTDAFKKIEM